MNISNKAEDEKRLRSKPPRSIGLSRKSPTTAPSGRVSMNADQKKKDPRYICKVCSRF